MKGAEMKKERSNIFIKKSFLKEGNLRAKLCLMAFMVLMTFQKIKAQDVHFSQFYEQPLLRNPALNGVFRGDYQVQMAYRSQWNSFTDAFKTGALSGAYKWKVGKQEDYLTGGLQMLFDQSGSAVLKTNHFLPAINYHKSVGYNRNAYISLGFMGGLVQKRLDRSRITTNSQFDGNGYNPGLADGEAFIDFNQQYLDGAVGISYNTSVGREETNQLYMGIAYHHFNRPINSFYRNPGIELSPRWSYNLGIKLHFNEYTFFNIQADVQVQNEFQEIVTGTLVGYKIGNLPDDPDAIVSVGTFFRFRDALVPVASLEWKQMRIGISYDVNVSSLTVGSRGRGGTEITLAWQGFTNRNSSTRDAVRCPAF